MPAVAAMVALMQYHTHGGRSEPCLPVCDRSSRVPAVKSKHVNSEQMPTMTKTSKLGLRKKGPASMMVKAPNAKPQHVHAAPIN
jgi:hypothetical protein